MHSSSKPNAFSSPNTTPRPSGFTDSQNPGSPRPVTGQTTPMSPSMQSRLDTPLKIGDFYTIDSSFNSLSKALKSGAKGGKFVPEARLVELEESIQTSTRGAEADYKRNMYFGCHMNLAAAKSAQVSMLSIIDDTPVENMPNAKRTALHDSCCTLGSALTAMMLKAKRQVVDAKKEKEKEKETDQGDDDQGQAVSPPSSPAKVAGTRHVETVSPAHGSKKRAQGDAHSPVLPQSASKRQKAATSSSESSSGTTRPIASSTASTTPTTAVLQSPPSYLPVPQSVTARTTAAAAMVAPGANPDTGAPESPATNQSPQKKRTLGPQARPRSRSQLFMAPPDFSREIATSVKPTEGASTPVALASEPGVKPADKAHRPQTDAGGLDQRS